MLKKLPLRVLIAIAVAMAVVVAGLTALFVLNISTVEDGDGPLGVGSLVRFGSYEWRVLDVQDGKALLLTEHVIARRPYNETHTYNDNGWIREGDGITWEDSAIRMWLNSVFLARLYRERIVATTIINHDNPWGHSGRGGNDTLDYVFLLSFDEVQRYFPYDETQQVFPLFTDRIAYADGESVSWWLRTPGQMQHQVFVVLDDGQPLQLSNANEIHGVRPALWVSLEN